MTKDNKKITEKEMEDSILRSGYLLEQRVEVVLEKNFYFVTTNDAYPDPVTGKSREIDINALSAFKLSKDLDFLFSRFLCECENNHQPVVFFVKDSPVTFLNSIYLKCAGLPVQFIDNKDIPVKGTLQKFMGDFFAKKVEIRMRPSYFPFVEPGAEVDIGWCQGKLI